MKLVLLVGCMASGKDTLLKEIVKEGVAKPVVSHTTRPMRRGEVNGVEYHFVSKEEILKMKDNDEFIEFKSYKSASDEIWYYGINKNSFDINSEENYITIVDIKGMREIKEHMKNCGNITLKTIFVDVSKEERKRRAMLRDDITPEKEKEIIRRLKDDDISIEPFKNECDIILLNEDYDCLNESLNVILNTLKEE